MKKRIAVLSIGIIAVIGAAGCAETKSEAEPKDEPAVEKPSTESTGFTAEQFVDLALETGEITNKDIQGAQELEELLGYDAALKSFESGYGKPIAGVSAEEVLDEILSR